MRTAATLPMALLLGVMGCGGESTPEDAGFDAGQDAGTDAGQDAGVEIVTVMGTVVDSNGAAVPGAVVVFHSDPVTTTTVADGTFEVEVAPGEHALTVSKYDVTFHESTIEVPYENPVDLGNIEPTSPFEYSPLMLREHGYFGESFLHNHFFAALTPANDAGKPLVGLDLDQFRITEAIVRTDDGTVEAEQIIDLPAQIADEYTEAGVYEKPIGPEKLDIVVIMDITGSMGESADALIPQLHTLIDMLQAAHVDFRMSGMFVDVTPDGLFHYRFYDGNTEVDKLREDIDYWYIRTGGEGWSPSVTYDAILAAPYLGFRDDARKVLVVVTDIVPQTVYGTFWYIIGCTDATSAAVEQFAENEGFEIYYSQNPAEHHNFQGYCHDDINPRACDGNEHLGARGSAFPHLRWGEDGQAVQLDWPFRADDLYLKMGAPRQDPADAKYYAFWESAFTWDEPVRLRDHEDDYEIRVTAEVLDPGNPGEYLTTSFRVPLRVPFYDLTMHLGDEEGGNANDKICTDLYYDMGGRLTRTRHYGTCPEDGVLTFDRVSAGAYVAHIFDSGKHGYSKDALRAQEYVAFGMPGGDHTLPDLRATTGEHLSEKYKLLGFLDDLDAWRLPGKPFRRFGERARAFLSAIEADGLSWKEMAALKRLNVSLSGYANLTEYAQVESIRAIEDFQFMVHQIGELISEIRRLQKGIDLGWEQAMVAGLLKALYAVISQGRINALLDTVEWGINALIDYASGLAFDELIDLTREKLLEHGDGMSIAVDVIDIGITLFKSWDLSGGDQAGNREKLWEAAQKLGLKLALYATREFANNYIVEEAYDALELDDDFSYAIKELLQEIIGAALSEDGFDDFDARLGRWAAGVADHLLDDNHDQIVDTVNDIFDRLDGALEQRDVDPMFRDFVLGFLRDLSLECIPTMEEGRPSFQINSDRVIDILVKHAVYNLILRDRYVDEIQDGMDRALSAAWAVATRGPEGATRGDWELDMKGDFKDYRGIVEALQTDAWNALSTQDIIDDWAQGLRALQSILGPLADAVDVVAYLYPPLAETADNLHRFALVLDTIQVVKTAIEFGLKVKCLATFGDSAETLFETAF